MILSQGKGLSIFSGGLKHGSLFSSLIISIFVAIFVIVLVRTAWTMDDSWITFRVIDNFINGHGLTWNTDERVQVYTHPLWMFTLSLFYFFTHELYYTSIIVSISISSIAIFLFAIKIARSTIVAIFGISVLILSKAFTDFSTAGLENPLTHLFLVIFLFVYFKREMTVKTLLILSLIASLASFNRADTILLFIPVVLYGLIKIHKLRALFLVIVGFIPFISWEIFSLFYYGDLLPNPSYAKIISTGIDRIEVAIQGLYYLLNSITIDHLTLVIIAVGIILPILKKEWRTLPILVGIFLYLIFVISIGGDFMSGRMLTAPLLVAIILISQSKVVSQLTGENGNRIDKRIWLLPYFVIIFLSISSPHSPVLSGEDYGSAPDWGERWDSRLIADDRAFHYPASGLLRADDNKEWPNHIWRFEGEKVKESGQSVVVFPFVGYYGFFAGPKVHVVDTLGITEPLLARLPAINKFSGDPNWRVGHIEHMVPQGYIESLETGQNKILDKNLSSYYDKLNLIMRGELFDGDRIKAIIDMNLGKYKHLIDDYVESESSILHVNLSSLEVPKPEGTIWNDGSNMVFFKNGVEINLNGKIMSKHIQISLDNGDDYQLIYLEDGKQLTAQNITAHPTFQGGLHIYLLTLPDSLESGYDTIRIVPLKGDGKYSVGHIKFLTENEFNDLRGKILVSLEKNSISYGDIQKWSVSGIPPNENYVVTIRWESTALSIGSYSADSNGESSGSFEIGNNIPSGTMVLRIELTTDSTIFGESSFQINP